VLGIQPGQPAPNIPMLTRMDRGPGLALAVRGDAPFSLTPTEEEVTVKPGGKIELALKVARDEKFKDPIQIFSATPNFGPRAPGNQPPPVIVTVGADKTEAKISLDVPANTAPGTYTLVLRGQSPAPPPKGGQPIARAAATFPSVPVTVVVEKK